MGTMHTTDAIINTVKYIQIQSSSLPNHHYWKYWRIFLAKCINFFQIQSPIFQQVYLEFRDKWVYYLFDI